MEFLVSPRHQRSALKAGSTEHNRILLLRRNADFINAAEAQIHRVVEALKQGGKDAYQPSEDGSEYPILAALNGRRMKEYLNVDQLGGIRK